MLNNFADILYPLTVEEFFADYYQKKYCHVKGKGAKFAQDFTWQDFNHVLNQTHIWSSHSLKLVRDNKPIKSQDYCYQDISRDNANIFIPDLSKVMSFIATGASVICNAIDTLNPNLSNIASILEDAFNGQVQSNLYCSRQARQAFHTHFDTHEVFAFHFIGTKTWRIYKGQENNPVNHPYFKDIGGANAQDLDVEITMEEGDFLYIPRGLYHDALAGDDYSLHVTFGITPLLGLDIVSQLHHHLTLNSPLARQSLMAPGQGKHDKADSLYLKKLQKEIANFLTSEQALTMVKTMRENRTKARHKINLPLNMEDMDYYIVDGLSITKVNGNVILQNNSGKQVTVPPMYQQAMSYIISNRKFTRKELISFLGSDKKIEQFINDLSKMGVL